MNKRLFYYLFAVLCTVTLFTSCSDDDGDDTPTVIPIEQEIAGDYKGTMDVYYVGVPDPIASGLSQKVYVTKASDTAVKLELRDFVFFLGSEELNLGTIAVENCPVTVEGTSYKFSGNQKMTLLVGDCDVAVSGTIGSGNLAMIVDVKVGGGTLQITEDLVGPYELHDFFLYYFLRCGFRPSKIFFLAARTFKGMYDEETIKKWLQTFCRRFFNQQFKRSCLPDGPKVGSISLSPRGDWRMPSDASSEMWLREVEGL